MCAFEWVVRVIIVAYFVAFASAFAFWTPVGAGFDENNHLAYVSYVARTGRIPNQYAPSESIHFEGHQPPLYYFLAASLLRRMAGRDLSPRHESGAPAYTADPHAAYALRVLSIFLATLNLILVFRIADHFALVGWWRLFPGTVRGGAAAIRVRCGVRQQRQPRQLGLHSSNRVPARNRRSALAVQVVPALWMLAGSWVTHQKNSALSRTWRCAGGCVSVVESKRRAGKNPASVRCGCASPPLCSVAGYSSGIIASTVTGSGPRWKKGRYGTSSTKNRSGRRTSSAASPLSRRFPVLLCWRLSAPCSLAVHRRTDCDAGRRG